MPKLFHGLTENIKKSWMMSENIFPKIKLFLKERLKQFTGLHLGPKIVIKKKNNTRNQDKNKNVLWHRQKRAFNIFHLCWLICKFIVSGSTRTGFSTCEKRSQCCTSLAVSSDHTPQIFMWKKRKEGKRRRGKRRRKWKLHDSCFPLEPSWNKLQVPWPNAAAAQHNWWVPRSLAKVIWRSEGQ